MHINLVLKLNQINANFYSVVGEEFDDSRSYYWQGWDQMLLSLGADLKRKDCIEVLDVGCGNGRFASYLADQGLNFRYTGVDNSASLLKLATKRVAKLPGKEHQLLDLDIIQEPFDPIIGEYDLVVLFGVMHHIPSYRNRVNLIHELGKLLRKKGSLVVTFWDFLSDVRLSKKVVPWDLVEIDATDLEKNDYLLDWKRGKLAYRYVHYCGEEEIMRIIDESGMQTRGKFLADGKNGALNKYYILVKK